MASIDYYFSTLSPYTYLAGTGLEEIAARHGATVHYKPLDILALFARTGGTSPPERHVSRQQYRLQDLARRAVRTGLKLNPKPPFWPTNPAPSSYAIIAAQNEGESDGAGGDMGKLVHGICAACWAGEKDIAEESVLRTCLSDAGFDPDLTSRGLLTSADTYAHNLEDAVAAGVFGAPFYITGDDARFWGQDRLEDLDAHLAGKL